MADAAVARRAQAVADSARDGAQWLEQNHARLHLEAASVAYGFRRFARRARRLCLAAERPTAVAVFGASQAGKSYLVSGLAAPRGKPLVAIYGDQRLNFLTDLNPEGGKESTGLVSRFTLRRMASPPGTPVPLRLLSQIDVVKILANTFLEDFQHADIKLPGTQKVAELLRALESHAGPAPRDGLSPDDIEEMREYFDTYFRGRDLIRDLGAAYWTRAAELIPRLPASMRAQAYAPLWNSNERFTALAGELIGALTTLRFSETAFCTTEALLRRGGNLLDAATVLSLGQGAQGSVRVATTDGASTMLDRAVLAALIAEVTVPLCEQPWDFFEHTDLLDFPGARSRKEHESVEKTLASDNGLGELFLRGKVAYLFQRYNAEQEIAAMLLCVGPSVQEVSTLPKMVTTWIGQTMGGTPQARAAQRTSLFLVLTKFDLELDGKLGEDIVSGQRWTNRLTASLIEPFGSYDWPANWTPAHPFDNTFWLRSTSVPFHAVYDYGEDKTETVAARATAFLNERIAAYRDNTLVRAHFADPAHAWAAALEPNDGGITFLADSLRPICDPALKIDQIRGRVAELAADIVGALRPYFHTGDLVAELERAQSEARVLVRALVASAGSQMFGALLRLLQVTTAQVDGVYWDLQTRSDTTPVGQASLPSDYENELVDLLGDAGIPPQIAARDRFEMLADMVIAEWSRSMLALAEDVASLSALRLPRDQALVLARELERAARRLDLRGQMAEMLRQRASFHHRSAAAAQKPVMVAEQVLNNFVYQLGFDAMAPDARPEVPSARRRIFAPRAPITGLPPLSATPTPYDRTFHVDWMTAMAQLFEDNARDAGSGTIDIVANAKLGEIIARLDNAA